MGVRPAIAIVLALLVGASLFLPSVRPSEPPGGGLSPRPVVTDAVPVPIGGRETLLPPGAPVRLTLTLGFSNSSRLSSFLASVEDPTSPGYRHFLSAPQFQSEFAPTRSEVVAAETTLRDAGGRWVTATGDRIGVAAVLPASKVDSLFGVRLVEYRSSAGVMVYTALGSPAVPGSLEGRVVGLGGLSDVASAQVRASRYLSGRDERPVDSSQFLYDNLSASDWAIGSDFAQAYHVVDLWPGNSSVAGATYPRGVAIATLLAGAYNESQAEDLPPWDPAVIDQYFNDTFGPGWPHPNVTGVPVTPAGAPTPPAPGSFGALVDSSGDEAENSLDLEMAGSMAPGSSLYNFYFAGSLLAAGSPVLGSAADDFADDLAAALSYDYGPARLAAVSASFGIPELNDSLWNAELTEAAVTGVTVVCSSGDQGDAPSLLTGNPEGAGLLWPASAGTNITGDIAVGGVTAQLLGSPTSYATGSPIHVAFDPHVTGLGPVVAWYHSGGAGQVSGSEGGISTVFAEPGYEFRSAAQPAIVAAAEVQRVSALGRAVPDVALPANDTIAYVFANATGTVYLQVLGGTSVAAPLLAGLLGSVVAVENATLGQFGLGFVTPELYRIASFYASPSVANSSAEALDPFLDVYNGSNYLFAAVRGWNAVTGWGGVNATAFLGADENSTVSGYQYTGPTPGLPAAVHPPILTETDLLVLGVGGLVAVVVIVVTGRPTRVAGVPPAGPPGHTGPASPFEQTGPAGAQLYSTFLCPYCGGVRPSEPVRCPYCGRF